MTAETIILAGEAQRRLAADMIANAPAGAIVTIREATRSAAQNAKLWAMLRDVSDAQPEGRDLSREAWKALFLSALGYEVRWESGLDGRPPVPIGQHSSRLTVGQMAELIEIIYEYGARHGVKWSEER